MNGALVIGFAAKGLIDDRHGRAQVAERLQFGYIGVSARRSPIGIFVRQGGQYRARRIAVFGETALFFDIFNPLAAGQRRLIINDKANQVKGAVLVRVIVIMAHRSGAIKKSEFIAKIGSFDPDPDPDPDPDSIKIRNTAACMLALTAVYDTDR